MNTERAAMRGHLAELKEKQAKLRLLIEGDCRAVRTGLNTALTAVDDLEIPLIAQQMDQVTCAWGELAVVNSQIDRLEKELA